MDYQLLMKTAVLAGEIMLRSGAETYRVEETISYILNTSGIKNTQAFVMLTGIMASIQIPGAQPLTVVVRVRDHKTDLRKVTSVNTISRKLCSGEIGIEDAYGALLVVDKIRNPVWFYNICIVGVTASFAILLGGSWEEVLVSAVNGGLLAAILTLGRLIGVNSFFQDVISAFIITAGGILCNTILPFSVQVETAIISSMMPLVPGVAITNAVRDTLQKDYISGSARALEAFLKAAAIAIGVGLGILVFGNLSGGVTL